MYLSQRFSFKEYFRTSSSCMKSRMNSVRFEAILEFTELDSKFIFRGIVSSFVRNFDRFVIHMYYHYHYTYWLFLLGFVMLCQYGSYDWWKSSLFFCSHFSELFPNIRSTFISALEFSVTRMGQETTCLKLNSSSASDQYFLGSCIIFIFISPEIIISLSLHDACSICFVNRSTHATVTEGGRYAEQ